MLLRGGFEPRCWWIFLNSTVETGHNGDVAGGSEPNPRRELVMGIGGGRDLRIVWSSLL